MRFHVCALPHTHTTNNYSSCAYTMKVVNFCKMMKDRGHTVFLYSGEKNDAPCDEHIACLTEQERITYCGGEDNTPQNLKSNWDYSSEGWVVFNNKTISEMGKRIQSKDFICVIAGLCQKQIADAFPANMTVEFGVGYVGTFSRYRVFESYAWMHMIYGAASNGNPFSSDGSWWDAVIPGYLDPNAFPFQAEKDDYYMFIGRLIDRKGFMIASQVCDDLGARLVVCGQGDPPDNCDYRGVVGPEERGRLMAGARAVFVPTIYVEPFGNVNIEAQACGTPVITTDWGAFTETVVDGVTGFRCHTFGEFKRAALEVKNLDPHLIRDRAVFRYSLETIGEKYENYFTRLLHLWGDGWYEGRTSGMQK